ncbi:histidine phosphatase family protein [Halomonas sp. AOP12-C2-37]|uniref:Histidine phosphatase family protein n=1 Tax=Halomonas casei TaxID=2742613 RepID=A0ABR9F010_9GAMM|nr:MULTISPECIES: histidine phosphatase family protein [Halomonas]MBE0399813.1 histidine phosphatase family protein [Halomonas casei]PCC23627.1 phosphoglycerate mutase [Halomonas sp. JB37]
MEELWFIRHFRTSWNSAGRLQGQRDIALDDPLSDQDTKTLQGNLERIMGQEFALVVTSPLQRAWQTAALHGFPEAEPDPDLVEIAFGSWEGCTWDDLESEHPGIWQSAPHRLVLGEPFEAFNARIMRFYERVLATPGPVLAFGHGAWLGGLQRLLNEDSEKGLSRQLLGNGALLRLNLASNQKMR